MMQAALHHILSSKLSLLDFSELSGDRLVEGSMSSSLFHSQIFIRRFSETMGIWLHDLELGKCKGSQRPLSTQRYGRVGFPLHAGRTSSGHLGLISVICNKC